jgi:hypothetical protein
VYKPSILGVLFLDSCFWVFPACFVSCFGCFVARRFVIGSFIPGVLVFSV